MTGHLRRVEHIMGTAISLDIADPPPYGVAERLAEEAFAWLREVDERFSTYRPTSEISRLQAGTLAIGACAPDTRYVLEQCVLVGERTGGYFDAYATGRLDPSGYVKGWSVQVASDRLAAGGAPNHCLNAGGDIRVRGVPEPGRRWRIGVRHPELPGKLAWVLEPADTGIATSGTYERGAHVVDPYTGAGARDLVSVTVIGADLALADAYATAALAMGRAGVAWLRGLDGHEWAVIAADGTTTHSPALPTPPT